MGVTSKASALGVGWEGRHSEVNMKVPHHTSRARGTSHHTFRFPEVSHHTRRTLEVTLAATLLSTTLALAPPAQAGSTYVCRGAAACALAGRGDGGYSGVSLVSY